MFFYEISAHFINKISIIISKHLEPLDTQQLTKSRFFVVPAPNPPRLRTAPTLFVVRSLSARCPIVVRLVIGQQSDNNRTTIGQRTDNERRKFRKALIMNARFRDAISRLFEDKYDKGSTSRHALLRLRQRRQLINNKINLYYLAFSGWAAAAGLTSCGLAAAAGFAS